MLPQNRRSQEAKRFQASSKNKKYRCQLVQIKRLCSSHNSTFGTAVGNEKSMSACHAELNSKYSSVKTPYFNSSFWFGSAKTWWKMIKGQLILLYTSRKRATSHIFVLTTNFFCECYIFTDSWGPMEKCKQFLASLLKDAKGLPIPF